MLGGGEGKIHFHPENRAQPVPTSAPLAGAQPCSLCRGAQLPPNMAMLWPWFPRRGLAGVPWGRRGREPFGGRGGEWVRGGRGWCGAPHTLPRLGKSGGSAAHKQTRARSLPHHTQGSRPGPAAPAEAAKGAELPALHLGLPGAVKSNGKAGGVPLGLGEGRSALAPCITHGCPTPEQH